MKELVEKLNKLHEDLAISWIGQADYQPLSEQILAIKADLQSKGKTKEGKTAAEILEEFGCPAIPFDENVTMYYPAIISAMEEYAQSHANKDGWVSVEAMSKLADEFMGKAKGLMNDAEKNGNANSIQSISFNKEARGWKYACYMLRDAIGVSRTTKNEPQP